MRAVVRGQSMSCNVLVVTAVSPSKDSVRHVPTRFFLFFVGCFGSSSAVTDTCVMHARKGAASDRNSKNVRNLFYFHLLYCCCRVFHGACVTHIRVVRFPVLPVSLFGQHHERCFRTEQASFDHRCVSMWVDAE